MKNYKETTVGGVLSPSVSSQENGRINPNAEIPADVTTNFLMLMRNIIDERIEKRIKDGQDIARIYTAEIVSKTSETIVVGEVTISGKTYDVTEDIPSSIDVVYNENDSVTISNDTVQILRSGDKWIKICTYDGVNFYVLHKM